MGVQVLRRRLRRSGGQGRNGENAPECRLVRRGRPVFPIIFEQRKAVEDSTWSHVRSALSAARQGNIVSAKLHSELANNAVIILAHYMSDEDFSVFVQNLERVINVSDTKR